MHRWSRLKGFMGTFSFYMCEDCAETTDVPHTGNCPGVRSPCATTNGHELHAFPNFNVSGCFFCFEGFTYAKIQSANLPACTKAKVSAPPTAPLASAPVAHRWTTLAGGAEQCSVCSMLIPAVNSGHIANVGSCPGTAPTRYHAWDTVLQCCNDCGVSYGITAKSAVPGNCPGLPANLAPYAPATLAQAQQQANAGNFTSHGTTIPLTGSAAQQAAQIHNLMASQGIKTTVSGNTVTIGGGPSAIAGAAITLLDEEPGAFVGSFPDPTRCPVCSIELCPIIDEFAGVLGPTCRGCRR